MKAKMIDDAAKGRGHALLIVAFDDGDERPGVDDHLFVAVKSQPSKLFLQLPSSQARWVDAAEVYLPVVVKSYEANELILEMAPYFSASYRDKLHEFYLKDSRSIFPPLRVMTDHISKPPRELANIELPDPSAKFAQKAQEDVSRMTRADKPAPEEPGPFSEPIPPPPVETVIPVPLPPPAPKIQLTKSPEPPLAPPMPPPPPPTPSPAPTPPLPKPPAPTPSKAAGSALNKKTVFISLGVFLLLLIAGGLVYYFSTKSPSAPEVGVETPAASSEPAAKKTPLDEARELLRTNAAPQDLAAAVARLDGVPGAEDAVFLLLRKLAPTSPALRTRFAAFYDPLDKRPAGSVQKNAKYAYDEYEEARKAGAEDVVARQEALLDWAEANETSDDEGAKALLEMIDQPAKR
ncbi:MAG: hypothetical protein LBI10_10175 [Deltaproteobacteria bacterium]|jgi:hypothetical protein|nr:hypothetical protein [Deltaproteobacteria bacterium]